MAIFNSLKSKGFARRRRTRGNPFWKFVVCLYLIEIAAQGLPFIPSVSAPPSTIGLKVYAEAPSFARLDSLPGYPPGVLDPNGWFFQADLYNPTITDILVTGLRWNYNASSSQLIDMNKKPFNATCYDTRYFSHLPAVSLQGNSYIKWEYPPGNISLTVQAGSLILSWIEAPTKSIDNAVTLPATYYVQAYVGSQWISSPLYLSHGGANNAVNTVFRADFNLATDPSRENQTHPNPQWLFNEDRTVVAGSSRRVRVIPIASGKGLGISSATVNVTLPAGWSYVVGSSYNPYGETIQWYAANGRYRLKWTLTHPVLIYSTNQSMAQNYMEFNVTAPSTPAIGDFVVTSVITSLLGLATGPDNQVIYSLVTSPPTASFTYSPSTPLINQPVTFNASSSSDLDGTIANYAWIFGDGQTGSGVTTIHNYLTAGNYTVKLTVTDNTGLNGTTSKVVRVIKNPVASFTFSPPFPLANETITFNASTSSPNGGSLTSYNWDFGDSQTGGGKIVTHSYANLGNYSVTLTVIDSEGLNDSNTQTIRISANPIASFTFSPALPLINQTVTFNATLSVPNGGFITGYYWNFGDGETGIGEVATYSYTSFGNYTVMLKVTDSEGLNDTRTETMRIGCSPYASFTYSPVQPWVSSTITFNASLSQDPDGFISSYKWDFGDGNITLTANPIVTHAYYTSSNFTVVLTVFDNDGFQDSSTRVLIVVVHDVVILSVSTSAAEVNAGQTVTVTVVVENNGTTNESFNVTVYYNDTKLETQPVGDLAPDAKITLHFTWDTTGLTQGAIYAIKAETSLIQGETDTADDSLTGGNVRISRASQTSPFGGFLGAFLPYAIPFGAVIALFGLFAAVAVLRKPNNKQTAGPGETSPSELQPFVDMTGGELPDAYSVMIVGDANAGKSVFCQQLAHRYLSLGKTCIYITYDCFPDEIRQNMKSFKWDISAAEQNGNFVFVDCYSSIAGKTSQEKYAVKQSFALSELGIVISTAMQNLSQKSERAFLDSTAALFTRLESSKVVEFIKDRSAQIKGENGTFFFIVGKGTLEEDLRCRLEEIVDCIIELEVNEEKGETGRKMRIKKLRGRRFSDQWVSFKIDAKKGFALSAPKH
jgi:PKD repeat protein/KaiC/GvpD/RAD55 family RecA-like ATPase